MLKYRNDWESETHMPRLTSFPVISSTVSNIRLFIKEKRVIDVKLKSSSTSTTNKIPFPGRNLQHPVDLCAYNHRDSLWLSCYMESLWNNLRWKVNRETEPTFSWLMSLLWFPSSSLLVGLHFHLHCHHHHHYHRYHHHCLYSHLLHLH